MDIETTLNFFGQTEEALQFYGKSIEAEILFMMRFRDGPEDIRTTAAMGDKIFHATFRVGSTVIMASDCGCENSSAKVNFAGFSLALRVETVEAAERVFDALSDGGKVQIPLSKTFFATRYGIVIDRFGVSWKVMTESDRPEVAQTSVRSV